MRCAGGADWSVAPTVRYHVDHDPWDIIGISHARRRLVLFKHHFNSVFGPNVLKGVSAGRVYAVAVHLHVRGLVVRRDAESLVAAPADADPPGGADGPAPVRLGSDGVAGGAGTLPPPPADWTIKDKATVVVSVLVP